MSTSADEISAERIILTALTQALFDADPILYEGFAHTVYDSRPRPCDARRKD